MAKKTTLLFQLGRKWSGYKITGHGAAGSGGGPREIYTSLLPSTTLLF
jgi:hypothetical protein